MAKIKYWDRLKDQIERGKKGLNTGIPFDGFTSLSNHIKNIQQGRYDMVFAGTSVGKTAFVNGTYVFGAINFLENHPNYIHNLEIIYYSLEIPPEEQMAKHIAKLIWEEHGILTSVDQILSIGDEEIPPHVEKLIENYKEQMEAIQDKYIYFKTALSPKSLFRDLISYAEKRGKVERDDDGNILNYIPNDPSLITLVVIDHIGLINYSDYSSKKEAIDLASRWLVFFRNMCRFSPLVISQVNRGSEQMDRRDNENWMPMLSDIKDSGNTSEDANTVIAIASPFYYGVSTCLGYDITRYKDRYRLIKILKNRNGKRNLLASFLFVGEVGAYYQLPPADEMGTRKPEQLKKLSEWYAKNQMK
jgi:replicative DNA helicase